MAKGSVPVSRRGLVINPAYDPHANVWFLESPKLEAPTLRLLLAKLPPGTTVKNYYPYGQTPRPEYSEAKSTRSITPSFVRM